MPYLQRKARPTEIHTPWFRKGAYNVDGYGKLSICSQCKRLFNKWDARVKVVRGVQVVLCSWCFNGVEPCKVCKKFYNYGSLDFTRICEDCRNTGRDLKWQDKRREIKVIQFHK